MMHKDILNPAGVPQAQDVPSFARAAAILFVAFVLFLREEIARTAVARVFFFAREGAFFRRLYEIARAALPSGETLPPSVLLEVSRLATFGPSIASSLNVQELMRLWRLYGTQSPAELLRSLNLDPTHYRDLLARHGLQVDQPITQPWNSAALQRLLCDGEFLRSATRRLGDQRQLLLRYLRERGVEPGIRHCLIVDIGWRGTIQDNIALLLPDVHFHGVYLGLQRFLNPQPANVSKVAFGPDFNSDAQIPNPDLLHFVAPMEMLTNSNHGSVKSYALGGDEVRAECGDAGPEGEVYERFTRPFQDHVAALSAQVFPLLYADKVRSADLRWCALQAWEAIIVDPPPILMRTYFGLQHDESFGLGRHVTKATRLDRLWPLKLLLLRSYRKKFRHEISEIGWTPGYAKYYNEPLLLPVERLLKHIGTRRKRAVAQE